MLLFQHNKYPSILKLKLFTVILLGATQLTIVSAAPSVKLPHVISSFIFLLFLIPLSVVSIITVRMNRSAPLLLLFWGSLFLASLPLLINFFKMFAANLTAGEVRVEICNLLTIIISLLGFCLEMIPIKNIGKDRTSHLNNLFFIQMDKYFFKNFLAKSQESTFEIPGLDIENEYETFANQEDGEENEDSSKENVTYFCDVSINQQKEKKKFRGINLPNLILKHACGSYSITTTMKILYDMSRLLIPIILSSIILHVQNVKRRDCGDIRWQGYFLSLCLFFLCFLQSVTWQAFQVRTFKSVIKVKLNLIRTIFSKYLKVSKVLTEEDVLKTKMSDCNFLFKTLSNVPNLFSKPLQICAIIYLLYIQIGLSSLCVNGYMMLIFLLNVMMKNQEHYLKKEKLAMKNKRIDKILEILRNIKTVKLLAWEGIFLQKIVELRKNELHFMRKNSWLQAFFSLIFDSMPFVAALLAYSAFIWITKIGYLSSEKVFVSLLLFIYLEDALRQLSISISGIITVKESVKNINNYLNFEEQRGITSSYENSQGCLTIVNAMLFDQTGLPLLNNFSYSFRPGVSYFMKLKNFDDSFDVMNAFVGNIPLHRGIIQASSSNIAIVTEEQWMGPFSVRENILFGSQFEEDWYKEVLIACKIPADVQNSPKRMQTSFAKSEVQKIALARAVYRRADIYLMYQPLEDVDCTSAKDIMRNLFGENGILKDRLVIIFSKDLSHVGLNSKVLVLEMGKLVEQFDVAMEDSSFKDVANLDDIMLESMEIIENKCFEVSSENSESNKKKTLPEKHKLRSISLYISSGGILSAILLVFLNILNFSLVIVGLLWLALWGDTSQLKRQTLYVLNTVDNSYYCEVFGVIVLALTLLFMLRTLLHNFCAVKASNFIHSNLLWAVIRSKVNTCQRKFENQVEKLFGEYFETVDVKLQEAFYELLYDCSIVVGSLIAISFALPENLLTILPVFLMLLAISVLYMASIEQVNASEVASIEELVAFERNISSVLSTVRVFKNEEYFENIFEKKLQFYGRQALLKQQCSSWVQLRSDLASLLVVLSTCLTGCIKRDSLSAGWAGVTVFLSWRMVERIPQLVKNIAAIREYARTIKTIEGIIKHDEKEDDWFSECPPPESWPAQGGVHINKLSIGEFTEPSTPDENAEENNDRTIDIKPGEFIQIVDARNILFPAFCRVENGDQKSRFEGSIIIDGIDITKIGLFELRSAINIIPSEAAIFSGSFLDNIDPHRELSKEQYQHILATSGLIETISKKEVEKFNKKEKRLLALARALARPSKLIIIEGSCEEFGKEVERSVMEKIRVEFAESTIIYLVEKEDHIIAGFNDIIF